MNFRKYDIVVIGAGPAGSTAAILAKKKGFKVALLDRAVFPRDKICGDQIIINSLASLEVAGVDFTELIKQSVVTDDLEFYSNETNAVTFDLRESPVKIFSCKRLTFDSFLFTTAQNLGVDCFEGINNTSFKDQTVEFNQNNSKNKLSYSYLIGADGATSLVRRTFFNQLNLSKAIATRSYVNFIGNKNKMKGFYFKEIGKGGYFWIFPVNETIANSGVIVFTDEWKQHFKDLQSAHLFFAKKLKHYIAYPEKIETWQTPFLLSKESLVNTNTLLVGDAAGLVNPMLGHGIDSAIASSKIAIDCIYENQNSKHRLNLYSEIIYKEFTTNNIAQLDFRDKKMILDENFSKNIVDFFSNLDNNKIYH